MEAQPTSMHLFLKQLVEINSGSLNQKGVRQVQEKVKDALEGLGFQTQWYANPTHPGAVEQLLVGTRGQGPRWIDFVTHADTVFEPESGFHRFQIDSDPSIARGPGVIDDKGGIVIALEGIKRFLTPSSSLPLRFICSPTEELGSPGFTPLLQKLGQQSQLALGFEPALEDGSLIDSRRGNRWIKIEVHGKEGHAGRDAHHCVNAAHELAFKITQLHNLKKTHPEVTISTGQIQGGNKFNIVCGSAEAKVDVRFSSFEARDQVQKDIDHIIETPWIGPNQLGEVPQTTASIEDDCPPFTQTEQSLVYLQKYQEILQKIEGRPIGARQGGGSADLNYMSQPLLPMIDGLGAVGGGLHRLNEFIVLKSLEERSTALAEFLKFLASSDRFR